MVKIVEQNFKENKKLYNEVERKLRDYISENVPITHVGSTAIPEMYGKNIIDILVGAKNKEEFERISDLLSNNGWTTSSKSKTEIYQFFASKKEETSTGDIHIHLAMLKTDRYDDFITIKKYLLENKKEAQEYSSLKKEIVNSGIKQREDYKKVKSKYVSNLLKRARLYYGGA